MFRPLPLTSPAGGRPSGSSRKTPRYQVVAGHAAFGREVAQLDDLRGARAGDRQSRDAGVDAAVENGDEHAAAVVGRVQRVKYVHPGALERHETEHVRHCRIDRRLRHGGTAAVRWDGSDCRGRLGRGWFRDALARGAGSESEQKNGGRRAHHERPGSAKAPRWGPVNSVDTSRRNASVSRVSSGVRIASTKPRAPANFASSWCS